MTTRMLIDARHTEETRVAVLEGKRIEEFDFESTDHKQIKGNIYLAKVTRVEPSLQAAFVDFGGNRHGFLAFSEIHPDYYQIPHEDRLRLLEEEAAAAEEEERLRAEEEERGNSPGEEYDADEDTGEAFVEEMAEDGVEEVNSSEKEDVATIEEGVIADGDAGDAGSDDEDADENGDNRANRRGRGRRQGRSQPKAIDDARERRLALRRRYKIQDVIQRRQVLLVQVVKEERGNKGAALTTYLSLAGRYTVLMPNSSHGGGISRKIAATGDRKRLKQIVADLGLPRSMGLIVRTAGLSRTKTEIKRDFDYLARLWDEIRENTLSSTAPALIHSDSDLIKRAIRDIYHREIEEVIVEGEDGYKAARQFMKLLMPSHVRRIKPYSDPVPLFQRFGAEDQLRALYDPEVQLKSGGYIVINPTEALVSIDINSGRSTREHGIEQTAVATNLEAAREIARQLRLRDMAGLVVIDFIDMERSNNVRKVEKAIKEALKNDRARIQIGRISSFGLMEMSRQRLRTGVLEATTRECPHCDGSGLVRTASSAGLSALRLIEEEAAKGKGSRITLSASTEAAIYLLNAKRADLREIEERYGVSVEVVPEGEDEGAKMAVASSGPRPTHAPRFDPIIDDEPEDDALADDAEAEDDEREPVRNVENGGDQQKKKRRRRGGRGRNKARGGEHDTDENGSLDEANRSRDEEPTDAQPEEGASDNAERKPRKRRRGGRGRKRQDDQSPAEADFGGAAEAAGEQLIESIAVVAGPDEAPETAEAMAAQQDAEAADPADKPKPKRRTPRKRKTEDPVVGAQDTAPAEPSEAPADEPAPVKPARRRAAAKKDEDEVAAPKAEAANDTNETSGVTEEPKAVRRGWWQRTFGD
ncbi:ribonuclease E/G [Porphyrobacter sp. GA68]|uniref:Rne/Rng family ribonuclease n=1 Tax=Porphyrobacter sp. GA68 TaxID=2883480 RepID=UPI001D18FD57|nr:ribonuclease E/G [Porphyrobacter sp. GA68]